MSRQSFFRVGGLFLHPSYIELSFILSLPAVRVVTQCLGITYISKKIVLSLLRTAFLTARPTFQPLSLHLHNLQHDSTD